MEDFFWGDFLFQFGPIFIGAIFVIVIGFILFSIIMGLKQWRKNEQSPRLTVPALICAKRTKVGSRAGSGNDHDHFSSSYTDYFVTFEFDSKDRLEFKISGKEYGLLAEGDVGELTFQGTRFFGFARK